MFVLSLLFIISAILPQDFYASAASIDDARANSPAESFLVHVMQEEGEDTLSVTDPEIEAAEPVISAIVDTAYIHSLITVSFTGTFLLVLIIMLLSYQHRFPPKNSNSLIILFAALLLINCLTFFFPDIVEFSDFMAGSAIYIWYGSLSIAIHLLPFLVALTFAMRRLIKTSIHFVWLSAVPLVLMHLELGYYNEYLAGASVVVSFLLFYFLQRANRKKKIGVNHLLNGSLATFILIVFYLLNSEGAIVLETRLYHLVIALTYVALPLSFTFCILSRHISSISDEKSDGKGLASELEAANNKLMSQESQLAEMKQFTSAGRRAAKIAGKLKNPLDLVKKHSDESIGLLERASEEIKNSPYTENESGQHILRLLHKTDDNLHNIQKQGLYVTRLIKAILQEPEDETVKRKKPTDLNGLIQEYVNLAARNLQNGENPIEVDIDMNLDKNIGTVPLYTEDFSRVILSLCKNAFDAMKYKMGAANVKKNVHQPNIRYSMRNYTPSLSVETKREGRKVSLEMKYNASEVPSEISYDNLHALFESKSNGGGAVNGMTEVHEILRAHDSEILIIPFGNGTSVHIELKG